MSLETFTTVVAPTLGAILANLMYLGPLIEVIQARKKENLGQLNTFVFPWILGSTICWTCYGFVKMDPFVIFANIFGILNSLFYILTALRFETSKRAAQLLELQTMALFSLMAVLNLAVIYSDSQSVKESIFGYGALILGLIMFASPLSTMATVIKDKDASSINKGFLIMQLFNTTMWTIYGLVIMDFSILILNALGLVSAITQCCLVLCFGSAKEADLPVTSISPKMTKKLAYESNAIVHA
mmetsp:Transcript_12974/g.14886  ORF Transcript_12974/g.14886 Transcript_12974/m.14886 type:complete len:242 (-) Transcript_12974:1340-2065(-)